MLVCKHIKHNFLYMVISLIIAAQNQRKMSDAMDNKDNKDVITQSNSSKSRANECIELKNLKYKSMMLKNNQKKGDAAMQLLHNTSKTDSVINVEKFLEHERSNKTNDLWGKLDKTVKISKLNAFAKKYVEDNGLNNSDISSLVSFLTTCIDHKKIWFASFGYRI